MITFEPHTPDNVVVGHASGKQEFRFPTKVSSTNLGRQAGERFSLSLVAPAEDRWRVGV
jgi:hypothetical protein